MQRFALIVLALTLAAPVSATPTAATIVPGSAPLQADPPDVLADSSYSAFTCDTGLQIIGNPLQPTASPTLTMTHPASVQHGQPFALTTSFDRPNPSSYNIGGGITQHINNVLNFGLRLPVPLNAVQSWIGLSGGSWNSAWGAWPALTNSNSYVQAAHAPGDTGVPGGTPATIDFPTVTRQLVATGDAGSTIDVTVPGSADYNQPTVFFSQRFSTTGSVSMSNATHTVRCIPGSGANVTVATINVVQLQPQLSLQVTPNPVGAGGQLTLSLSQTSVAGGFSGGTVTFERIGAGTIGTATLQLGAASLVTAAPTTPGSVSYRASFSSGGNSNIANAQSNTVVVSVVPAAPATLTVVSGSGQSVAPGASFAPLVVRARDAFNNLVPNATVAFTAPASGASAVLSAPAATTNANGEASIGATANATAGSYSVTASVGGVQTTFALSNVVPALLSATLAGSNPLAIPGTQPGGSVSFTINVESSGSLPGPVVLSATNLPAGTSASFAANNLVPPASTTLTLQTSASTPLGVHTFTLGATSGAHGDSVDGAFNVSATVPGAGVISIDFTGNGTPMLPTEVAGVVATPNWNVANDISDTRSALFDETGTATATEVQWNANIVHALPIADAPGDARMMRGYLDPTMTANPAVVAVDGLPANAGGYLVHVYADGDNVGSMAYRSGRYRVVGDVSGDSHLEIHDESTSEFTGSFLRAVNSPGNYAVFPIRGTGFILVATPLFGNDGNPRAPINGIQIVPADILLLDGFE